MTRLEEEIYSAILKRFNQGSNEPAIDSTFQDEAKAAAEVAKRYIEKAYDEGRRCSILSDNTFNKQRSEWLKDKGITE